MYLLFGGSEKKMETLGMSKIEEDGSFAIPDAVLNLLDAKPGDKIKFDTETKGSVYLVKK